MTASSHLPAPNLMPLMRYRDLAEAMGWLEKAFAFEKQIAVSDGDGDVIYGQMTYRGGLIMMGAVRDTDLDKLMCQPDEVGGVETQSCYLVVEDADTHYANALEAGAEIVLELKSDGLGRRGYSCRDPEGHIWNFGTHNPGRGLTVTVADTPAAAPEPAPPARRGFKLMGLALMLALGAGAWMFGSEIRSDLTQRMADSATQKAIKDAERAYADLVRVRAEKRKAEEEAKALAGKLAAAEAQRATRDASAQSAENAKSAEALKQTTNALTQEQAARKAAEAAVASLREALKREQDAVSQAVDAKRIAEERLAEASAAAEARRTTVETQPQPSDALAEQRQADTAAAPSSTASAQNGSSNGTSTIETSATRPVQDEAAMPDDGNDGGDDEPGASTSSERAAQGGEKSESKEPRETRRASRAVKNKAVPRRAPLKLPSYATDVSNVWPYSGWTN